MPKIVDHDDRRRLVTEAAADLVAAGGTERLTVRAVASETGFSTAIVSHYFADKRDLLRSTFRASADRSARRFEQAAAARHRTVASCLQALLPLDTASRRDWQLFVAFWGTAAGDEEFAHEQALRVRSARSRIAALLEAEGFADGDRPAVRTAARSLLTVVQGIAVQAVFDPTDWTTRRQVEQLQHGLAAVLDAAATAGTVGLS